MPKSATWNTDARARTDISSSLPFPRAGLCSGPRRAVVPLRATHPGKPRRSATPSGACLATCHASLYAFSRVSRPRRLLLRARIALATGRVRRVSPERCVRRRNPPLFHVTPPGSALFRRVDERPDATSWRATWAEACETKDPCAPTPQGSGTPRVPLLAEGPEHPLSSPRVRV